MKRALLLMPLLAVTGCDAVFKPETLVDGLRVLSASAEPPDLFPGGGTNVEGLIVPEPGRVTSVLWIGCDPDPIDFNRSACNDLSILLQPTKLEGFPTGVRLLGLGLLAQGGSRSTYSVPANLFEGVAADDPVRQNGTSGPVLVIVVGEEVRATAQLDELHDIFSRMENGEVPNALALMRISVSDNPVKNHNPQLRQLLVDNVLWPVGARLQLLEGQTVDLNASATDDSREVYDLVLPSETVQRTEKLVGSWYSTAGRFTLPRVDLDSSDVTRFTSPGVVADDPVPERRTGSVFFVLRDGRGGQSHSTIPFYVCDSSPNPEVQHINVSSGSGVASTVSGVNMKSVLDIVIGGVAMANSGYSQVTDTFAGELPRLPAGSYPVQVHTKGCTRGDTGLVCTVDAGGVMSCP